ncbi:MAG: hypothetical protein HQ574_06315 [Chloroflexi bacterium]|nr:hypothetical protein [Chloroflexota bacterium]
MQIRCYYCKMPITIGQATVDQALNIIHEEDHNHFDYRCPKCKKTNKIPKEQLLRAAPVWEYSAGEKKAEAPPKKRKDTK